MDYGTFAMFVVIGGFIAPVLAWLAFESVRFFREGF